MTNTIPLLDLARLHGSVRAELDVAWDRALATSAFIGGESVTSFEEELSSAHGRVHAVGCASGTDALALALRATGIGATDEVIVPSMTFVATAEAVLHAGGVPIIVDVDPETLLIDPDAVTDAITPRTKAIVPVHLYGHVVPLDVIARWMTDGFVVIEDAAQAHLATWRGRPVGDGHAMCLSFYPGKNLGALGDAGAVLTDDHAVASDVRRLRDHGRTTKYTHDVIGYASRLDALQAAMLSVKLRHLQEWTEGRRRIAARYAERLASHDRVALIAWEPGAVHHLLVARVDAAVRDDVMEALRTRGIGVGIHYPVPLATQPALAPWSRPCPVSEAAASEILSLPMDPLMPNEHVDIVCDALFEVVP